MEITQFTYFQQVGGIDLNPVCVEITYGIERIAMYLQEIDNVYDLEWACGIKYGDVHHRSEVEFSTYNFEVADIDMLRKFFDMYESEAISVAEKGTRLSRIRLLSKVLPYIQSPRCEGGDQRGRAYELYRAG